MQRIDLSETPKNSLSDEPNLDNFSYSSLRYYPNNISSQVHILPVPMVPSAFLAWLLMLSWSYHSTNWTGVYPYEFAKCYGTGEKLVRILKAEARDPDSLAQFDSGHTSLEAS